MQRAPVADDVGGSLSKAGTDFLRRGGNDIVEVLSNGVSIPQADHDLGALLRRESRGESGIALQVGPIDETQLFYLESRGIPPDEARKFIVLGFLEPVVARVPLAEAQDRLRHLLEAKWAASAETVQSSSAA